MIIRNRSLVVRLLFCPQGFKDQIESQIPSEFFFLDKYEVESFNQDARVLFVAHVSDDQMEKTQNQYGFIDTSNGFY